MTPASPDAPASAPEATSAPAVAESSPAATESFTVPQDAKAYEKWRQTGTLPGPPKKQAAQPKQEEAATSTEEESAEGEEPEGQKDEPASETGSRKQEQPLPQPRKNAADRLNELLGDLKRAGLTPHELKTFKREVQQQTQPTAKAEPEKTAQPSAQQAEPPKLEDFKTWDEYRVAERKYNDDRVAERVAMELQQHEVRRQADAKMAEAKTRYGDEAETFIRSTAQAVFNDAAIPPVIKAVLNESGRCADLLYTLGSDPKELDAFMELARTQPGQALRKVILMEHLVEQELSRPQGKNGTAQDESDTPRDEAGKFVKAAPKAPPPPAREVSGKASAPPDPLARAIKDNDFGAYRELMNKRDIAARRGL